MSTPGHRGGAIFGLAAALLGFVFLVYWTVLIYELPPIDELERASFAEASVVFASNGDELTRYHDVNRTWVELDEISPHVVSALVATEDHRFYKHGGIDIRRTFSAVRNTLGGDRQGGSTITMQFARNAFAGIKNDMQLTRKIKEWLTARRIERMYEKDQILEMYLNTVPFLYNAFGIQAAARTYFSKPASDLDEVEAAVLIGMLRGTALYNPVRNPENSLERRNVVLGLMNKHGYLETEAYERLRERETELEFVPSARDDNMAPYFAEYLRLWLAEWAERHGFNLYTDGLRIHSTVDVDLQAAAEASVQQTAGQLQPVADAEWGGARWQRHQDLQTGLIRQSNRYREEVAAGANADSVMVRLREDSEFMEEVRSAARTVQFGLVAIDPRSGHVKAWVGGRQFSRFQYDHVGQAKRQPGSTFKPFIYAAAMENGYSPDVQLIDQQIEFVDPTSRRTWRPRNAGGAYTNAPMTLRDALAYSKNTIAAQLTVDLGPRRVAEYARRMGIKSTLDEYMSIGLGTSPVTLLELTAAYGTMANAGTYVEPVMLTRIEDRRGRTVATFSADSRRAISPSTAYTVLDMLRGTIDYGTGARLRGGYGIRGDIAGKTGTSQNNADGWFVAMHPHLVVGTWVGFSSPQIRFGGRLGQGSQSALPVVGRFLRAANLPSDARFQPPSGYREPGASRDRALFTFEDGRLEYEVPEFDWDYDDDDTLEGAWAREELQDFNYEDVPPARTDPETRTERTERTERAEPEPQTEAEELTRRSRERSGVGDALERLRRQQQGGNGNNDNGNGN
jgi:penicillin-binding protein 1A